MSCRSHVRWLSVLTAAVVAATAAPAVSAPPVPRCEVMDLSVGFARDGTAYCAGSVTLDAASRRSSVVVYRTTTSGRSWTRVAARGIDDLPTDAATVAQLVLSPAFASDRRVLIQLRGGMFESTDAGATFLPVDVAAGDWEQEVTQVPAVAAFADPGPWLADPVTNAPRATFGVAGSVSHAIRGGLATPVPAATPDAVRAVQFAAPPGSPTTRFLLGTEVRSDRKQYTVVYGCDAQLACGTRLYAFPAPAMPRRLWVDAGFARNRTLYAAIAGLLPNPVDPETTLPYTDSKVYVYRSRDGGRSFQPLASVNRILQKVYEPYYRSPNLSCGAWLEPKLGLAFDGGRMYLRVSGWFAEAPQTGFVDCPPQPPSPPAMPADAIYESSDGAATWRLVAAGTGGDGQRRGKGFKRHVPWAASAGPATLTGEVIARAGRLFVVATAGSYTGPWCSVDRGATWARSCRR